LLHDFDPRLLIDDLLEGTVVGSFSRIGPMVRERLFGWTSPPPDVLAGRTVLVTGPTSGLGRQVTDELAAVGARVVLVGRSRERLEAVRDALIARHGVDRFPLVIADMGSLESVQAAVRHVLASESRLDVIIDNAGAIFRERTIGPDGIEATLGTLVVGPFALIGGLLPLLDRTPGSRVIAVTSGGQYAQGLDLDDLGFGTGVYDGTRAYARAKRAQVSLIREWARRLGRTGIRFDSMHPGWAATPGLSEALPGFARLMGPLLRTPAEGTDTIVWLATTATIPAPGGSLWLDRRPRPFDRVPMTRLQPADRRRLWDLVVGLTGLPDPSAAHVPIHHVLAMETT
jgi:NAD(P)-dependent dehydrogenase (short-subunit alcohol dehydrogenase family)